MNRLIHEKSPYLLQHAENPVDWFPWGEEAFLKSKTEFKPIFLSIGYSTCHWCHVMEEESFSEPAIAEILNRYFVPIKVDREERPDVDQVYMRAVMAMTGSGGWPLNIFLTPEGAPFYGGTYFPPIDRWGSPAFSRVLKVIAEKWKTDQPALQESAHGLIQALQPKSESSAGSCSLDSGLLQQAFHQYGAQFDSEEGGFGSAPKFPPTHTMGLLLRIWKKQGAQEALEMVETTLQKMARGGIRDFLGGGFHRYSTDGAWRVPHFEKMLYDQAMIARCYLEAAQATGNKEYALVAREILDYVLRDLTDLDGGFYCAEDADSLPAGQAGAADPDHPKKKSEGSFYLWTEAEIIEILGAEDAKIFNFHFGVEAGGNAPHDPHGEFTGKNILYERASMDETAQEFRKTSEEIRSILKFSKGKLFEQQKKRPRPHLDDKILTDWNALMISVLALAGRVCGEPRYLAAAQKAEAFFFSKMRTPGGGLFHRTRSGEAGILGFLDDYAFMLAALLDLFESSGEFKYLSRAERLASELVDQFLNVESNSFEFRSKNHEPLFLKVSEIHDSALPSGSAIALQGLVRLGALKRQSKWTDIARKVMERHAQEVSRFPSACAEFLMALSFLEGPILEIAVAEGKDPKSMEGMRDFLFSLFLPDHILVYLSKTEQGLAEKELPWTQGWKTSDGKSAVWVCYLGVCQNPVASLEELAQLLQNLKLIPR